MAEDGTVTAGPKFELLPCCSARVTREVGLSKKDQLRAGELRERMRGE